MVVLADVDKSPSLTLIGSISHQHQQELPLDDTNKFINTNIDTLIVGHRHQLEILI